MSTETLAPAGIRAADTPLGRACLCIGVGLVAILLLFRPEAAAAVGVWRDSTAYNHCFLVIPIAIYLLWDRRADLAGLCPNPRPVLAVLALPLALAWLAAERLGVMEARQILALTVFELLVPTLLGWAAFRRLSGPLLYLYFLVPFGSAVTPILQDITAWFVMHGLDLLGIPNYTDGLTIQIPEGTFVIAEACAGLRFLIASVAFGCLYALLIYRSPLRRLAFIASSVAIPVAANGMRALGIVVLGHLLGSAQAAETDHVLYGWIFFSIVILLLIAAGLPFRQDGARQRFRGRVVAPRPRAPISARLALGTALLLALAAVGPATAIALTWAATAPTKAINLGAESPCREAPSGAVAASDAIAPGLLRVRRFSCRNAAFLVRAETFSPRAAPRLILHEQDRLTGASRDDVEARHLDAGGLSWHALLSDMPPVVSASLVWSHGRTVSPDISFRLRQAWRSISGGGSPIVLVVVTPEAATDEPFPPPRETALAALKGFLDAQRGWPALLSAFAPE